MSVDMHRTHLKVACEQRVFHLAPPLELVPLHSGVLLLQLHVDHQHFPLSVVSVIRIRHSCNVIYQKILCVSSVRQRSCCFEADKMLCCEAVALVYVLLCSHIITN